MSMLTMDLVGDVDDDCFSISLHDHGRSMIMMMIFDDGYV